MFLESFQLKNDQTWLMFWHENYTDLRKPWDNLGTNDKELYQITIIRCPGRKALNFVETGHFAEFRWSHEKIPLKFRKAGRVWCGGARETHWVTCHNRVTSSKTKESLKSSCFSRFLWYLLLKENFEDKIFTF